MTQNNTIPSIVCLTLETNMKIKVELELDTDNEEDLKKIEEAMYQLQQVKEILEKLDKNLNNRTRERRKQ
jgi:hypothetical protein